MADNECKCFECFNNEDDICDLNYLELDSNGMCLDKDIRSENG